MSTQLEDTKRLGYAKPKDCAFLLKSENLCMRIDEENDKKNDALKSLSKAQADIQLLRSKFAAGAGELSLEYERTHAAAMLTYNRGCNFDKVVSKWKAKADDLAAKVDACSSECRQLCDRGR